MTSPYPSRQGVPCKYNVLIYLQKSDREAMRILRRIKWVQEELNLMTKYIMILMRYDVRLRAWKKAII